MIKTFIFVEDGSVDLDELKSSVGDDVLVIPYRQGATPPAIQQPREPVSRREVNIKDRLLDLMIEFDEMGFAPTTVCEDPEGYAKKWKGQVLEEVKALKAENAALKERLEKAVELPVKVGDTVWLVGYIHVSADAHLQCVEAKIIDLMMMKDLVRYGAQEGDWCHDFTNADIGRWVFMTREAAEAKIAEEEKVNEETDKS